MVKKKKESLLKNSHHLLGPICTMVVVFGSLKLEEGDVYLASGSHMPILKWAQGNTKQGCWAGQGEGLLGRRGSGYPVQTRQTKRELFIMTEMEKKEEEGALRRK